MRDVEAVAGTELDGVAPESLQGPVSVLGGATPLGFGANPLVELGKISQCNSFSSL